MLYVFIGAVIVIAWIILFANSKLSKQVLVFLYILTVTVLGIVANACYNHYVDLLYSDLSETGYVKIEYVYDEPQYYKLEIIPESEDKYVTHINSGYRYCVKNNDGDYTIKNTNQSLFSKVEIVYTNENQPRCIIESGKGISTLTKKPSFWFNLFQWLVVKDYAVGDIVKEWRLDDIYTFYVPVH